MPVRDALAVLTRPAGRNEALASLLRGQGVPALCLPALALGQPPSGDHWVSPHAYDLVVFVSGHAASCYLQGWRREGAACEWPARTLAATVGTASAQPLFEAGWIPAAQIVHPEAGVPQDSESLWRRLHAHVAAPQRVLIVGAREGRDWLRQQFLAQGCQVDRCAVYERTPAQWAPEQAGLLRQAVERANRIACLLTSAQGVDAFDANLRAHGLTKLYSQSGFVAIHARVASRLQWQAQRAGCGEPHIELCMPDNPAILTAVLRMLAR